MDERECWLCHRKQNELLEFAKDETKCSDDLAECILSSYDHEGSVFIEIDVLKTKIIICPVCYTLIESIALFRMGFKERLAEVLQSDYRLEISGRLVQKET